MIPTHLPIRALLDLPETHAHPTPPSFNTVAQAVKTGSLPHVKLGGARLVAVEDYLTWLAGFPHKPGRKEN